MDFEEMVRQEEMRARSLHAERESQRRSMETDRDAAVQDLTRSVIAALKKRGCQPYSYFPHSGPEDFLLLENWPPSSLVWIVGHSSSIVGSEDSSYFGFTETLEATSVHIPDLLTFWDPNPLPGLSSLTERTKQRARDFNHAKDVYFRYRQRHGVSGIYNGNQRRENDNFSYEHGQLKVGGMFRREPAYQAFAGYIARCDPVDQSNMNMPALRQP